MRGHVDGGGGEDGHVGDEPFQAVLGEEADAVAGLDAGIDEGGGAGQARLRYSCQLRSR